jgi:hypothetical protein|eukprot:COSAG06_NODE_1119_length_10634_cov_3.222117_12_plen_125_part_00
MDWLDLLVSLLVLVAVSLVADHGGAVLAAVAATAPTGVPLSLWLVKSAAEKSAATTAEQLATLDGFLASCIRGGLAAAAFAAGALWLVRSSKATGDGVPTLGLLLVVGYGCWGTAWALLRHLPV